MFTKVKSLILPWLKIPPEPQAPAGAPESLKVFRAAPNYYRLRLLRWGFGQLSALAGLIIALVALREGLDSRPFRRQPHLREIGFLLSAFEVFGVIAFVVQLPFTYAVTRLDYELRWYLVTDRSLRIRTGVWTVEELTMTFANVQELTIRQGPLQRLLGIADLKVRSAGGGGSAQPEGAPTRESHVAYFHGVDKASEIRDLILAHLRRLRDTGLGDPDGLPGLPGPLVAPARTAAASPQVLAAAQEVLAEVRALREGLPT